MQLSEDMRNKRLCFLHDQFLQASKRYPFLYHSAVLSSSEDKISVWSHKNVIPLDRESENGPVLINNTIAECAENIERRSSSKNCWTRSLVSSSQNKRMGEFDVMTGEFGGTQMSDLHLMILSGEAWSAALYGALPSDVDGSERSQGLFYDAILEFSRLADIAVNEYGAEHGDVEHDSGKFYVNRYGWIEKLYLHVDHRKEKVCDDEIISHPGNVFYTSALLLELLEWSNESALALNEAVEDDQKPRSKVASSNAIIQPPIHITRSISGESLAKAAEFIKNNPNSIGQVIANQIGVGVQAFRSNYVPALREMGVVNNGSGYEFQGDKDCAT